MLIRDQKSEAEYLSGMLKGEGISVLRECEENSSVLERFFDEYYASHNPRIVICGINPGRRGAGKNGILFIEFCSLAKILSDINRCDSERSAQFSTG
jgi:hypothetical protein